MVRNHQINPEDLVRRNTSHWVPAFGVKGLFEAAAKPPAVVPVPPAEASVERSSHADRKRADEVDRDPADSVDRLADDEHAADWYCIASGEKRGPLEFKDLQLLARAGKLRDRDRVWRGSSPKYQKASEVDGLLIG